MSSPEPAAHDAAASDAHAFDGEPARELAAGEPLTPGWLPALGLALFLGAAVAFLASSEKEGASAAEVGSASAVVAAKAPAPDAPPPPPIQPARLLQAPAGAGTDVPPALRQLSPDQIKELQKRIEERQQQGQKGVPAAAPAR